MRRGVQMRRVCRIHLDTFLYWGIHVLYWRYVGEKLSQIFSKVQGVPDAAGLSNTFLVLEILVEKNISNFLKFSRNTFLCIGKIGKLSQII